MFPPEPAKLFTSHLSGFPPVAAWCFSRGPVSLKSPGN